MEPSSINPGQPDAGKVGEVKKKSVEDILLERELITKDQLEIAIHEHKEERSSKKMLGTILVEFGFINEQTLAEAISAASGVRQLDLKSIVLDPKLINLIPKDIAIRCKAIPVGMTKDSVSVAMSDVYNILALDQLRKYFPKNIKIIPVYAQESQLHEVIDNYYSYEMTVEGIIKEMETGVANKTSFTSENEHINPNVRLVNAILVDAIKSGASDIHFEPEEQFLRVRYRIDGKLLQVISFHKEYWSPVAVRIKILSSMNIAETRNPQDGRINFNVMGRDVDFRVASQPTIHGENIVMRILDKKQSLVPLEDLGFSKHNTELLKRMLKRPEGIIIVTGPTGSGKTTSLYSILGYINTIERNIMTLEDPVEYQISLIRQTNVKETSGMNFHDGIKSLMRQDPDVIFVGEVRDEDTAIMALRAAMTGHQVFTTLHTTDSLGSIPRLMDIGVAPSLLAGSLSGVLAQRLARKLCDACKLECSPDEEECRILGIPQGNPNGIKIFRHVGCPKCHKTGYKGRTAITEILRVDRNIDEMIATSATRNKILEYATANGFIPMIEDGISKVLAGVTDLDELISTIDMTTRL